MKEKVNGFTDKNGMYWYIVWPWHTTQWSWLRAVAIQRALRQNISRYRKRDWIHIEGHWTPNNNINGNTTGNLTWNINGQHRDELCNAYVFLHLLNWCINITNEALPCIRCIVYRWLENALWSCFWSLVKQITNPPLVFLWQLTFVRLFEWWSCQE